MRECQLDARRAHSSSPTLQLWERTELKLFSGQPSGYTVRRASIAAWTNRGTQAKDPVKRQVHRALSLERGVDYPNHRATKSSREDWKYTVRRALNIACSTRLPGAQEKSKYTLRRVSNAAWGSLAVPLFTKKKEKNKTK